MVMDVLYPTFLPFILKLRHSNHISERVFVVRNFRWLVDIAPSPPIFCLCQYSQFLHIGLSDTPPADCGPTVAPAVVPVAPPSDTVSPTTAPVGAPVPPPVGAPSDTASPTATPVNVPVTPPVGSPVVPPVSFQPTVTAQPTITLQPTTTMFPSIDSVQPSIAVPSTTAPATVDQPTTAPTPADETTVPTPVDVTPTAPTPVNVTPTTAPTSEKVTPTTRAPTPAVDDAPTAEPSINAETDEPTQLGEPTIEPTFAEKTKPPKYYGKGKGFGKGNGKGKGKGRSKISKEESKGKGKGNGLYGKRLMHMYVGKSVVQHNKGYKLYSKTLFRNIDSETSKDYDTSNDGENGNFNLFPLIQGP